MEQHIVIGPFLESDRAALRKLYLNVKSGAFPWLDGQETDPHAFDRDTESESIWVARLDGQIAGFIAVWEPDNFIHHLYVEPSLQRRGIGSALINFVLRGNAALFRLKCLEANHSAVIFYRKTGWAEKAKGHSTDGPYILFEKQRI